jgi:iron complex transport system ATP-binding protein
MNHVVERDRYLWVSGINKTWRKKQVINERAKSGIQIADLYIGKRERIAVLGPSGSGKSTFLKLLAKDINVDAGSIYFLDKSLDDWSHQELSCYRAVLPQSQELTFDFSVDLIVELGCVNQKNLPNLEVRQLIKNSLECACASHLAGQLYTNLSGGEKARVQLARVFAQMWGVCEGLLLVDEPFAALDPYLQIALLSNLGEFAKQRDLTVIAILHDINHAVQYFDRALFVRAGQVSLDKPMNQVSRIDLENLYGIKFFELLADNGKRYFFPQN